GLRLSEDLSQYEANDATVGALERFIAMNDDEVMPRSVWLTEEDPNAMFKTGQIAAYYSGSWQIADFIENIADFEWVSVPMPAQPDQATNFGAAAQIVVFEGTGQEEQALDFVKWLFTPENYAEISRISGFLPATEDVEVSYEDRQEDFDLYNAAIQGSPDFVAESKARDLELQAAGTAAPLSGDPLRDETVKAIAGDISPRTSWPTPSSSSTRASPEQMTPTTTHSDTATSPPPVRAGDGARRPNAIRARRHRGLVATIFLLPAIVLFAIFFVGPAGLGILYSFTDYRGYGDAEFVGLENYTTLFADDTFYSSLLRTVLYTVIAVPFGYFL